MSKLVLGLILGVILGVFDGLTALMEPDISNNPQVGTVMTSILIGSSVKGLLAGLIIGLLARKVKSLKKMLILGGAISLVLAFLVAAMPDSSGKHYWIQIMLPGTIVGLILGYATQKYGKYPKTVAEGYCEEATDALLYAIMSIFCFGPILGIFAISKANKAENLILENPQLQGLGKAGAAKIIAKIAITIWSFGLLVRLFRVY